MEIVRTNHERRADLRGAAQPSGSSCQSRVRKPSKSAKRRPTRSVPSDTSEDLVEDAERRRTIERLERALRKRLADLAAQDRVIIALRFDHGLSMAEIAKLRQQLGADPAPAAR